MALLLWTQLNKIHQKLSLYTFPVGSLENSITGPERENETDTQKSALNGMFTGTGPVSSSSVFWLQFSFKRVSMK